MSYKPLDIIALPYYNCVTYVKGDSMKKTHIRLPEELLEKINNEADSVGVGKSEYIRFVLIWWFNYVN